MNNTSKSKSYWKKNIRYVLILLGIWFLVSYGAGILFKDEQKTFTDLLEITKFKNRKIEKRTTINKV